MHTWKQGPPPGDGLSSASYGFFFGWIWLVTLLEAFGKMGRVTRDCGAVLCYVCRVDPWGRLVAVCLSQSRLPSPTAQPHAQMDNATDSACIVQGLPTRMDLRLAEA